MDKSTQTATGEGNAPRGLDMPHMRRVDYWNMKAREFETQCRTQQKSIRTLNEKCDRLAAQRDELLAACKRLANCVSLVDDGKTYSHLDISNGEVFKAFESAIAKAEGRAQ